MLGCSPRPASPRDTRCRPAGEPVARGPAATMGASPHDERKGSSCRRRPSGPPDATSNPADSPDRRPRRRDARPSLGGRALATALAPRIPMGTLSILLSLLRLRPATLESTAVHWRAAEFSLTALGAAPSTPTPATAAGGTRWSTGPPHAVVPAVRRPDRHLDHHPDHRLPGRTGDRAAAARPADRRQPARAGWRHRADRRWRSSPLGVDGVRRAGAHLLAVAVPLRTARVVAGPQVLFSAAFTPLIHLTNGAPTGCCSARHRARRRTALGAVAAGTVSLVRTLGAAGLAGPDHRGAGGLPAVRRPHRRGVRDPRTEIDSLGADDTVRDLVA